MMTDISKEAVELHIQRCWLTDPEPDRTETLLRALSARVEELEYEASADFEMGRLQGLTEALKVTIPSTSWGAEGLPQKWAEAIEALKEQSQ